MTTFSVKDLPITVKSVIAPIVACVVIMALAATFYWSYDDTRRGSDTSAAAAGFSSDTLSALAKLSEGHAALIRVLAWKQAGVDPKTVLRLEKETGDILDEALVRFQQLSAVDSVGISGEMHEIIDEVGKYRRSAQEVLEMVDGDIFFATMLLTDTDYKFIKLHRTVDALSSRANENRMASQLMMVKSQRSNLIAVMSVTAIGIVTSVLTAWWLARMISQPVLRMTEAMRQLAAHQLETPVPGLERKDEIGEMAAAVQVFKINMADNYRLTAEREKEHVERRELAEKLLRERSLFFAAASHDLRQPIYAVRLLACAINDTIHMKGDGHRQELIEPAAELNISSANLSEFLDQLLDISRIQSGGVEPSVCEVSLAQLFADLIRQFNRVADAANVRLLFVCSSLWVKTDPVLCRRVLANLLSNAIKFSEGGTVLLGCRRRGADAELMVCDNGVGIDLVHHGVIFEDFRQLSNDARQRHKGVGLGLGIVQRIATLLGHPLSISSKVGVGSVFSILVPIAGAPSEEGATSRDKKRRI